MPIITYTATARRTGETADLTVHFDDGRVLRRTVTWNKIDSAEKLAAWLLVQAPEPGVEVAELRRSFSVDYHLEWRLTIDGRVVDAPIIDQVTDADLPDDADWARLASSQLGTVTLAEALAAVDGAATVAQLRTVVRLVVMVVIPLRDVVDRVLTRLRRLGLR